MSSSGEHVGHGSHGEDVDPPTYAPAASAPPPPPDPQSIHEWANEPHRRRPQKRKPPGDATQWRGRDDGAAKMINNQRNMLLYELQKALKTHDALTAESAPAEIQMACNNLEKQYRKLYYLEHLNIVIKYSHPTGVELEIVMNKEQIQRNRQLRLEQNALMIANWQTTACELRKYKWPAATSKASSSAGPAPPPLPPASPLPLTTPPPPAASARTNDAAYDEVSPSYDADEPLPAPGTVIMAAPTAKAAPPAVTPTPAADGPPGKAGAPPRSMEVDQFPQHQKRRRQP